MIRIASTPSPKSTPDWHATFVKMLPAITRYAKIAFRHLTPEAREEPPAPGNTTTAAA
jgi:hypothetical protein